jgi:hypothetical protein
MRILVRNVLLVALLSGILFLLLEGGVRLWAPQQTRMEMLSGESLAVLSIPQQFQVLVEGRGYRYEGMDMHYIDRELGRLAVQEGFRWISTLDKLSSTYRENREDLYYRFDGHLNERGNRVVAEYFSSTSST